LNRAPEVHDSGLSVSTNAAAMWYDGIDGQPLGQLTVDDILPPAPAAEGNGA
jgi:hypothetical protein